ncbi:MAG: hypothetical protein Q4A18_00460 [Rikenellaceae bacterium]|nr:hypothetical protein [Rikenellaceae bacterium]
MKVLKYILSVVATATLLAASASSHYKAAPYKVLSKSQQQPTVLYTNPFSGSDQSVLEIAVELEGLTGFRLAVDEKGAIKAQQVDLQFSRSGNLLVAATSPEALEAIDFGKGRVNTTPVLKNALRITEVAPMNIYAVRYTAGKQSVVIPEGLKGHVAMVGYTSVTKFSGRDAAFATGEDYPAFVIEGFSEKPALFTIIGGQDDPVVNEGMPGTEGIQGGFEGGQMIKLGDTYHMFPTERAGEEGMPAYYDRIKTRIGHWTSKDAIHWERQSTLYQSSGKYAVSHYDHPMNDRRAAIWSYMPIFNKEKNRWQGHYLAYTCDFDVAPNHSFGRIWRCESVVEGIEGIGGPYRDCGIVIEPGLDSQLWEGRQGVASFFPYQVGEKWYGFISGAYPYETKADYPFGGKPTKWYVGLAEADNLEGPFTRMKEINPITSIHPRFVENPIVSQLPNGLYIAVFDGGPEWLKLPNMIAYTLSKDGVNWSEAHYIPIDTKVKKWWHTMRTPLGLIPEGDNVYTIVYAAINNDMRFHPMGMVQVKLNPEVLEAIAAKL